MSAQYAEVCGWCLAHAHARSGEAAKISGYLGKSDAFDKATADFCIAYADQSERDHEILMNAVRAGRLGNFHRAGIECCPIVFHVYNGLLLRRGRISPLRRFVGVLVRVREIPGGGR